MKGWMYPLLLLSVLAFRVPEAEAQTRSRYFLKDKACWQDADLVMCYQRCTDPQDVFTSYSASDPKSISKSISERKRNNRNDVFGCPIKCFTDPEFENCKLDCKPTVEDVFSRCIGVEPCTAWTTPSLPACTDCYKEAMKKNRRICSTSDLPRCNKFVDDCLLNTTLVTGTASLAECFSTREMEADLESCQQSSLTCNHQGAACDNECKKYLTNKYCQDTCISNRRDSPFQKCLVTCDTKTYPVCEDSCPKMEACLTSCKNDTTLSCFSICRGRLDELTEYSAYGTFSSKEVRECKEDTLANIKKYVSIADGRSNVFPGTDDTEYDWLLTLYTPEECIELCSTAFDKQQCYKDQYNKPPLSDSEKSELCSKDPLRIKALVQFAAASEKSLQLSVLRDPGFVTYFEDYLFENATASIKEKFYGTFIETPVKDCKDGCAALNQQDVDSTYFQNAACNYHCFERNRRVCKHDVATTIRLSAFSTCRWLLDLSSGKDPTTVTTSYFNEQAAFDVKDTLEKPNSTQYLQPTSDAGGSTGFFAFPYFLIIRADCDGGYYDESFYKLFMDGSYPIVNTQYWPITARDNYHESLLGTFISVLVDLKYDPNDVLVPENPLEKTAGGAAGCHSKICYPGFALPLMFYRIPIFEVTVEAQDVFEQLTTTLYVGLYNNRAEKDLIKMSSSESLTTPSMFFPKSRITKEKDTQLKDLEQPDSGIACLDAVKGYCPDIEHKTDLLWEDYTTDNPNPFEPLDGEDLFAPQYTFYNAPAVAIAGFYNPSLVIIGDPDFEKFHLIDWDFKDSNISIFDENLKCLQRGSVTADDFPKPIYSQIDRNDPKFPLKFYRVRYDPREYGKADKASSGIFEIISMEDRLLITTTSGLVVLYGTTNDTVRLHKAFQAVDSEKLRKCFKFIRVAKRAQMESDIIIGVTYDYDVFEEGTGKREINQEIWVGKLSKAGEPIAWHQIIKKGGLSDDVGDYFFPPLPGAGELVTLDPGKQVGIPVKVRADNAKSEIEALCFSAYKSRMASSNEIQLRNDQGWCEAIDATPVVTKVDTIQVLVRMTVKFTGKITPEGSDGSGGANAIDKRFVVLYIVASHVLRQSEEQVVKWTIDSIVPRIPCSDEHKESVRNILLFDLSYFSHEGTNSDGERVRGCQNINGADADSIDHIYLTSLTYTRMLSNHVFVYGTRLLQSADGGQTFVSLKSFPHFSEKNSPKYLQRSHNKHRIEVMAFSSDGHYAFLTNKRELWIGNTGDVDQIRIRPSTGYSMMQSIVSKLRGLQDGIPFTILYDRRDNLFEIVSVLGDGAEVEKILKRPVPIGLILRNQRTNDELQKKGKELKDKKAVLPVTYDPAKWSHYCPFSTPKFAENYSTGHSRNQKFFFSPPRQHPLMGKDYQISSLMAFQVSTFSLIWKSFFNVKNSSYSLFDTEPFQQWVDEKQETATVGLLKFLRGNPEKDGILVTPNQNKRVNTEVASSRIFRYYYLDYGLVLRMELTYSIKNENSLSNTDYFTQKTSQIQLNVDNANGSLLQIDTEKVSLAAQASVKFVVHISVIKNAVLKQQLPGEHAIPVPIVFHLIGAFGNCLRRQSDPSVSDTLSTLVYVGCPPATDILFNWNDTLRSIKFRDKDAHYGRLDDSGASECFNNEFVCFFARQPLILYFDVFDLSKQSYAPYTGNYIMRIIGGGYTRESLRNSHYTEDEQEAYNIPGVSDVSLIWNEWDIKKSQKIDRNPGFEKETGKVTKDVVLQAGKSAVQWACHTLSPCARITPNLYMQTVYFFRISISNKDVDNNTLCLYEKEFDIMLYGFPPSPETQLLTTVLFCLCMVGILYLLFFCCRGHKRVWRATKVKMYGWYQIVKDTFPKPLKKHEAEGIDERQSQQDKDNIILSLQGHLNVPHLVARDSSVGVIPSRERDDSVESSRVSSSTSIRSTFSTMSTQNVLNPVTPRNAATTWTDLVYEQIISKRLTAIIEKNKKMRENILRKANTRQSSELEQEKRYEHEHKRTVSDESLAIPKKKDES